MWHAESNGRPFCLSEMPSPKEVSATSFKSPATAGFLIEILLKRFLASGWFLVCSGGEYSLSKSERYMGFAEEGSLWTIKGDSYVLS